MWLLALPVLGFVAGTVFPEVLKDGYAAVAGGPIKEEIAKPRMTYSSQDDSDIAPQQLPPQNISDTHTHFSRRVTISNIGNLDGKDVEVAVIAPYGCRLNDSPRAESIPATRLPLMQPVQSHLSVVGLEDYDARRWNIKFIGKKESLILRYDVECSRSLPKPKLVVNMCTSTCTASDVSMLEMSPNEPTGPDAQLARKVNASADRILKTPRGTVGQDNPAQLYGESRDGHTQRVALAIGAMPGAADYDRTNFDQTENSRPDPINIEDYTFALEGTFDSDAALWGAAFVEPSWSNVAASQKDVKDFYASAHETSRVSGCSEERPCEVNVYEWGLGGQGTHSSVADGTYTAAQTVTISDAITGATFYYTISGSTPTNSSSVYSGPITLRSPDTLPASLAASANLSASPAATAAYTIDLTAAAPTFSVASGTYTTSQTVAISDATIGATIYYTTDGSTPTASSTVYTGPITLSAPDTLQALAVSADLSAGPVATAAYTIKKPTTTPVFSVAAETESSDSKRDMDIHHGLDGSRLVAERGPASRDFTRPAPARPGFRQRSFYYHGHDFAHRLYYLHDPGDACFYGFNGVSWPAPDFSVGSGTYTTTQNVAFSSITPGTSIYYTTNGSTPMTCSMVAAPQTIHALAVLAELSTSPATTATYIASVLPAPTLSVAGGIRVPSRAVTVSDATAGMTAYSTTSGKPLSLSSTPRARPIRVANGSAASRAAVKRVVDQWSGDLQARVLKSGKAHLQISVDEDRESEVLERQMRLDLHSRDLAVSIVNSGGARLKVKVD